MKKRGFTLTEVLGVIVILGLIALIIFPNVSKSIKNSKQKLYNEQIALIEENARKWGVEHTAQLPNSGSYYLELNDLVLGGYISQKELKDPRNNSTMEGCIVISYDPSYNQYKYLYTEASCEDQKPVELVRLSEKVNTSSDVVSNDPSGNRRYVGPNPNNYIRFNNELWRIIGVFNGQVKIVRNEYYNTNIAWDNNNTNDWNSSTLKDELNTVFYDSIGTESKSYIDTTHIWNLGGVANLTTANRSDFYNSEKGVLVAPNRPTSWTGAVGLIYPSDMAYATNGACDSIELNKNSADCYNNSWLYSSTSQWTLTPYVGNDINGNITQLNGIYVIKSSGIVDANMTNSAAGVRPVVYLKADVKVESGSGSNTNPFNISL